LKRQEPFLTEWYSFANPDPNTAWLFSLFLARFLSVHALGGLILGVLDITGVTAEFDWDSFGRWPTEIPPDVSLLALSQSKVSSLSIPSTYDRLLRNGLLLLSSPEFASTVSVRI
jgi:hypothetical protein